MLSTVGQPTGKLTPTPNFPLNTLPHLSASLLSSYHSLWHYCNIIAKLEPITSSPSSPNMLRASWCSMGIVELESNSATSVVRYSFSLASPFPSCILHSCQCVGLGSQIKPAHGWKTTSDTSLKPQKSRCHSANLWLIGDVTHVAYHATSPRSKRVYQYQYQPQNSNCAITNQTIHKPTCSK